MRSKARQRFVAARAADVHGFCGFIGHDPGSVTVLFELSRVSALVTVGHMDVLPLAGLANACG